jgi:hypothetical protein
LPLHLKAQMKRPQGKKYGKHIVSCFGLQAAMVCDRILCTRDDFCFFFSLTFRSVLKGLSSRAVSSESQMQSSFVDLTLSLIRRITSPCHNIIIVDTFLCLVLLHLWSQTRFRHFKWPSCAMLLYSKPLGLLPTLPATGDCILSLVL